MTNESDTEEQSSENMDARIDFFKFSFTYHDDYIQFTDKKARLLLAFQGATLGIFGNIVFSSWPDISAIYKTIALISLGSGLVGGLIIMLIVIPRNTSDERNKGYLYWENIRSFNSEKTFADAAVELDDERAVRELAKGTYAMSEIAITKWKYLRMSVVLTGIMFYLGISGILSFILDNIIVGFTLTSLVFVAVLLYDKNHF